MLGGAAFLALSQGSVGRDGGHGGGGHFRGGPSGGFHGGHIMKDPSLSRRRCLQLSALAGCSLILTGRGLKAQEPLPADYIQPGPITALGKAPGLRSQLLSQGSSRTYAIIFGKYM